MNHAELLRELESYVPNDERERTMTSELVAFVRDYPDCFERTSTTGHITASAWVLDQTYTHVLLTHHRKLGRWLQLGGHADGDEDLRRVALREAREEAGFNVLRFAQSNIYDVDVHLIPARRDEPAHKHYDVRFALVADRAQPIVVSPESYELAWFSINELDCEATDESVRRLVRKTAALATLHTPSR